MTATEQALAQTGLLFKYVYLTILVDQMHGGLAQERLAEFANHSNAVMINRYHCVAEGTVLDLLLDTGQLIFDKSFNGPFMAAFEEVLNKEEFKALKDYLEEMVEKRS